MDNRTTVGDYVTLQRGITYKGNLVGKPGPALLGLGSIRPGGGFREGDYKTYGGECPSKIMLHAGDLFVSLKGATKDGKMIGSIARVPQSVPLGRLTQDTVKLQFCNTVLEEFNFLYWVLRTPQYRDYCASRATGSAVVALSRDDFLSYPVPNLNTYRRRIVKLLEALDDKIELNQRINAMLEEMAQLLFKSWFVDFDPVIDNAIAAGNPIPEELAERAEVRRKALADGTANREAAKQFPAAFQLTEEMGWIPEGWEVKALDEIADYRNGLSLQKFRPNPGESPLPIVKIAQLKNGEATWDEVASPSIVSECIINDGDVVFSWSGSLMIDLWCGGKAALNQHLFKVTSTDFPKWFYLSWSNQHLHDFQRIAADKAVTMGHIKRCHLSEAKCAIPDSRILTKGSELINPYLEKRIKQRLQIRTLTNLRDTLLHKLISGELRIADAEKLTEEAIV